MISLKLGLNLQLFMFLFQSTLVVQLSSEVEAVMFTDYVMELLRQSDDMAELHTACISSLTDMLQESLF